MQNDAPNDRRQTTVSGETEGESGEPTAPTLRPGETFADRYHLEERVGSGGMGELFRAFDTRLQRRVALKVLRRDGSAGTGQGGTTLSEPSARILREARAAAALNHSNVVAIHDVGERDGVPFIAMEYVKGKSLRAFVGAPVPSYETRLEWVIDVARALAAAHDRGLVHRDVKPDNVMIRDDGMVKVLDFGIARYYHPTPDSAQELRTQSLLNESGERGTSDVPRVLGTPGYMAPEQIRGDACDGRADQFAWGVMAYELFGGQLPWPSDRGPFYVMTSVLSDEPVPLANVPVYVWRVIQRALEKKAQDRFPSMHELVAACGARTPQGIGPPFAGDVSNLLAAATGEAQVVDPLLVQREVPTGPKSKPRGFSRASRAIALGLVVVAAAVTGFFVVRSTSNHGSGAESTSAQPPPHPTPPESPITPVVALRLSPTCSRAADAPFREGLTAMREATWELALPAFERAASADPACPEPQLQRLIAGYFRYSITKEREQFRRVNSMRDALGERDRVLLDAFAPLVAAEPADREEAARRLVAATARYPLDAQMLTVASVFASFAAHDAHAVEQCYELGRRATEIDPRDADGWQQMAVALARLGRLDEGMAALDKCLEVAPGSGDCLEDRIRILRLRGQCAEASAAARRWLVNVPSSYSAYRHLANALASEGAPSETVQVALEQFRNHSPSETREANYLYHRSRLEALNGNFVEAEKFNDQLGALWQDSVSAYDHVRASMALIDILNETGRRARAVPIAEQFFRRRDAWTEGFWSSTALEPIVLATLVEGGTISRERWSELTSAWEKRAAPFLSRTWGLRWGSVEWSRAVAVDAWKTRPPPGPAAGSLEQPMSLRSLSDILEGHAALMAGEYAQAIQLLEPATKSCDDLEEPFASTRGHLWLGRAREGLGDRAGACAAYADVVKRWGDAKPRSSTAEEAKRRQRALGCAR
ncbi:protein kinase domain-containing protein [Pendulispora albinea]|uniref:Protein kinase n=1 Tax=Pendulispora albinea TaxID=2741071 RepID=A0ABZ2LTS9_9BACT